MRCHACQTENAPNRKFCAQCGAPLNPPLKTLHILWCISCGADLRGKAFCPSCGTDNRSETLAASAKSAEPSVVIDPQVIDKLAETDSSPVSPATKAGLPDPSRVVDTDIPLPISPAPEPEPEPEPEPAAPLLVGSPSPKKTSGGSQFCKSCGAELGGNRFCPQCGHDSVVVHSVPQAEEVQSRRGGFLIWVIALFVLLAVAAGAYFGYRFLTDKHTVALAKAPVAATSSAVVAPLKSAAPVAATVSPLAAKTSSAQSLVPPVSSTKSTVVANTISVKKINVPRASPVVHAAPAPAPAPAPAKIYPSHPDSRSLAAQQPSTNSYSGSDNNGVSGQQQMQKMLSPFGGNN